MDRPFTGLTRLEAEQRLGKFGPNELPSAQPKKVWEIGLEVLKEPMFLLLMGCAILYSLLGDYQEGAILLGWVWVIIAITFFQSRKTERALEALRNLSAPRALVMRGGTSIRIPGREVVPGDILLLHEGDRVPADAEILETTHLLVDESLLTGESVPVQKSVEKKGENHWVFSGSLVLQGRGVARVAQTGASTRFGKIGTSLQAITPEQTRLQREMKTLIRRLGVGGIFLTLLVVALFYSTRGNFLESLLHGLSCSMAILPEEFPVVLTIFLALGAWRLSRRNVLTRKPAAIETLGSATVLCSDKTGTITLNQMQVALVLAGNQTWSAADFARAPQFVRDILEAGAGASNPGSLDPMDKALFFQREQWGLEKVFPGKCLMEFPLGKGVMAMSRGHQLGENEKKFFCKGAPESVFALCRFSSEEIAQHQEGVEMLAKQGFRVLAVAESLWGEGSPPENQQAIPFRLLGLLGYEDPVRPEVPQAVADCHSAGIRVIMITGDYPATAAAIAKQIGLPTENALMSGEELAQLSDEDLIRKIKEIHVFARIVPEQKMRIVRALQASGEVVAMTGDGVNDAPALKAADIGVAMGQKGTDVAREASALVLLDDNFTSIVKAIRSGRRIFDNLQKAMSFILAIHLPIIGLAFFPALFPTLPILLFPLHIVFLELIIDPICSIAFETEKEELGIMNRPPRSPQESFFGASKIIQSVIQGLLLLGITVFVYFLSLKEGHTEGEIRAIAFSTLILGNIFLILSKLSKTRSFVGVLLEGNWAALSILGFAFIALVALIRVPFLEKLFGFQNPGWAHFGPTLLASGAMLALLEGAKFLKNRKSGA